MTQFSEEQVNKYARFMPIAWSFASMSRDPSTKVGALLLGGRYEVLASGWNGAPRGCNADKDERYSDRNQKLWWATHAEANAVANAAMAGTSTHGAVLVVTHPPCITCAKLAVQAGVAMVICNGPDAGFALRWASDLELTKRLFKEVGVKYMWIP